MIHKFRIKHDLKAIDGPCYQELRHNLSSGQQTVFTYSVKFEVNNNFIK